MKTSLLRRIKKSKIVQNIDDFDSCFFPGNFIANSLISCVFNNILFMLILTGVCHPLLWKLVLQYWPWIAAVLIAVVAGVVLILFGKFWIYSQIHNPTYRGIAHGLEAIMIFIDIIGGAATSCSRIAIGLLVMNISFMRIDKPILADWELKWINLDFLQKSFLALIKVYCQNNNPIAVTFQEYFLAMEKNNNDEKSDDKNEEELKLEEVKKREGETLRELTSEEKKLEGKGDIEKKKSEDDLIKRKEKIAKIKKAKNKLRLLWMHNNMQLFISGRYKQFNEKVKDLIK